MPGTTCTRCLITPLPRTRLLRARLDLPPQLIADAPVHAVVLVAIGALVRLLLLVDIRGPVRPLVVDTLGPARLLVVAVLGPVHLALVDAQGLARLMLGTRSAQSDAMMIAIARRSL